MEVAYNMTILISRLTTRSNIYLEDEIEYTNKENVPVRQTAYTETDFIADQATVALVPDGFCHFRL